MRTGGTACAAALQGKIELRSSQFKVVTPFGFWVETEGGHSQEIAARCCVGQIEYMLGREQALVGINRITRLVFVITERKIGSQTAGQTRTYQGTGLYLS
jgi:hypothetical protein